jgi:sulfate transport system ATP-binding protein
MRIELREITKTFGQCTAVQNVNLLVPPGTLAAVLGPSGSGKTTLLRLIAGLDIPNHGTVLFDGADATHRRASERRVGFVFQHYALFRHLTVFENIAFGLRVKPRHERPSEATIKARVAMLLALVQLEPMARRYPSQLSGGQRQRVALARALAVQPQVLLLDEPFGALDAKVRQELRGWLRRLHDEMGMTSVFVTHDQEEALEVADQVVIMREGRVEQVGSPEEVYAHPATPFVSHFLGQVNLFHGRVEGDTLHVDDFTMAWSQGAHAVATPAVAYVRPHMLEIDPQPTRPTHFCATITRINAAGPVVKVELATRTGTPVHAAMAQERYRALQLHTGEDVGVRVTDLHVFTAAASGAKTCHPCAEVRL